MSEPIKVLDRGFVSYIDHFGSDLSVVNSARVSMGKRKDVIDEKDIELVDYLAQHEHWSPFRHAAATLHFKAPLFVKAQVDKHQVGVSINSLSGRYAEMKDEFYVPDYFRQQAVVNKQGSEGFVDSALQGICNTCYETALEISYQEYQRLLKMGVAREQARCVLPTALYTEWYMTASLQAWAHFLHLRLDSHAQWEIQEYARAVKEIITPLFPVSLAALERANVVPGR